MDIREKLVEVSEQLRYCAIVSDCKNCKRWDKVCENKCVDNLLLMVADLIDSVAHGVTVQEWISVKDRLPKGANGKSLCENVIAYLNNGEIEAQVCPGWLNGDKWYLLVGDEDCHTVWGFGAVTHWKPMPQPPKGE